MKLFDFTNDDFLEEKAYKNAQLEDLNQILVDTDEVKCLDQEFFLDLIDIIEVNISRKLPSPTLNKKELNIGIGFSKLCHNADPQMLHLDYVYRILISLINILKNSEDFCKFFDDVFTEILLKLLDSEDETERDYIVEAILLIYKYSPTIRNTIELFINQKLKFIIENDYQLYHNVDNLLEIYLFLLDNEQNGILNDKEQVKLFILLLHRLSYRYYFYVQLYSIVIKFLRKYPNEIINFIQTITQIQKTQTVTNCYTTNHLLTLIELHHILNLLLNHSEQSPEEQPPVISNYEIIFKNILQLIMPLLMKHLKSLNVRLISCTIHLLTNKNFEPFFRKHLTMATIRTLKQIMNNRNYYITWDYRVHVQQVFFRNYLNSNVFKLI